MATKLIPRFAPSPHVPFVDKHSTGNSLDNLVAVVQANELHHKD
jgi:hypothetical protein